MSPRGSAPRGTPALRTPDIAVLRISSDARASHAVARALVLLIERIEQTGAHNGLVAGSMAEQVRDALRQLTGRSRDGSLLCRISDGALVLEGAPIDTRGKNAEPYLVSLLERLVSIGAGSLTVREGAAPGELLTLAGLLVSPAAATGGPSGQPVLSETPTTVRVLGAADDPRGELLRTWSVLVTPLPTARPDAPTSSTTASVLGRIAAIRSDAAASGVIAVLVDLLDDAQRRGDAVLVDGIARGCVAQMTVVGSGGGRLALEGLVRQLLRPPLLTLLAQRLPRSPDRAAVLQLLARAGAVGVDTLLEQLLATDDALARRAYFDGIVAMDVASPTLFLLLHDARWFVVRNAAALLGEMNVEGTDDALLPLLQHADERIRIAVARALTRVRTPEALHGLHGAISDPVAEVRRLSAAAYGIAGAAAGGMRPPAARLAAALETEVDEDVALEMLAALGRLGSADAVQRLLRIAIPSGSEGNLERPAAGRDPWQRIAALEALVRARGHALLPAVEGLMQDPDREVAAAATRLRATVQRGVNGP